MRARWRSTLEKYGVFLVFVAMVVVFCFTAPHFATWGNARVIITHSTVIAIAALGLTVVVTAGETDLSMGGTIGFLGAFFVGLVMKSHFPAGAAAILCVVIGLIWGTLNGWLVTRWSLSSFLVTVVMLFLGMGFERAYTHGLSMWLSKDLRLVYKGFLWGIPNAIFFLLGLYVPFWFWSTQTRTGHHIRAIGENTEAAREAGIKIQSLKVLAFSISGGLYAVAGLLETMRASGAIAYAGMDVLLPALGATFLGATMFRRGPNVLGTLVGSLVFGTITNAFTLFGAPFYLIPLVQGLLLVAAVSVSTLGDRRIRQVKF